MKALVYVGLKPGVLDPQGRTIARSLNDLGFDEVESALQGKVIELNLSGEDKDAAKARVTEMCEKLLANTVIENYRIEMLSYGDYLRSGAIASRSPIVRDIKAKSEKGLAVAGFCNGFQILTEAGMLPGALMRNQKLKFVCRPERLQVTNANTRYTKYYDANSEVVFPVAHHDGNYFADKETLNRIEKEGQVAFRYADNPNGSLNDIAGITNADGNVLGMMPHPERAIDPLHGGTDGIDLFKSIIESI